MFRLIPILAACAFALPAHAFHCPADMAEIDAALASGPQISSADLDRVKALRAEGEKLHGAGDHGGSVDRLGQALQLLGLR